MERQINKIAKQPIIYSNQFSLDSNDFIDRLLAYQLTDRLNQINIKNHRRFIKHNVNWNKLNQYRYKPNATHQKEKISSVYKV